MSIPESLLLHKLEEGLISSLLPGPPITAGRKWSYEKRKGTKEKPSKTTTSVQKWHPYRYRQRWPSQGASWLADKTIFWARGTSHRAVRLFYRWAKTAKRWPSKTILGSKCPASKTMLKQKLDSSGRETEGVCKRIDEYNPGSLCVGHYTRESATIQIEVPLVKTYQQVWGKSTKDSGEDDDLRCQLNTIWGHHRVGPREQGILCISFPGSQEKWGKSLYHESKSTQPIHYLHKAQSEHSEVDAGGHSSMTVGSLTWHHVSILPHSNSKETSLLPSLSVERQSLLVQDLAFWSIHCSQDLIWGSQNPYFICVGRFI